MTDAINVTSEEGTKAAAEGGKHAKTLALRRVAPNGFSGSTDAEKNAHDLVECTLRSAKLEIEINSLVVVHAPLNVRFGSRDRCDGNPDRITQHLPSKLRNAGKHGGRQQQGLPTAPYFRYDLLDVTNKSRVEHHAGPVEHQAHHRYKRRAPELCKSSRPPSAAIRNRAARELVLRRHAADGEYQTDARTPIRGPKATEYLR
jgi:hypothetical protein